MDIPVYNMAGEKVDRIAVDEAALGGKPNLDLIRQAVLTYEANQRVGTVGIKNRCTVSGSGRRAWSQKHTGRARHGSRRSPLWVGGAVAHGPQLRDHRKKLNKTMRRRALQSAFLAKAIDGEVLVVDHLELPELKTRAMAVVLKNLGVERTVLVVLPGHDAELWRCTRNIPGTAMAVFSDLNAYSVIRPREVLFTRQALEDFLAQVTAPMGQKAGAVNDG